MSVRLQKALADAGLGSRRACERLITEGRVTVDGVVAALGSVVHPASQEICVDGRPLSFERKEYWLLNKPKGVLSTARDEWGRRTVIDLVPSHARLYPVGRLDRDTTGVLLLTNDGELTARLLHPRHHVPKEYLVTVEGRVSAQDRARLEQGVALEEGPTAPASVRVVKHGRRGGRTTTVLSLILHEGKKRQVRRMMETLGYRVVSLHRSCFAGLSDAGLGPGEVRRLSEAEVESLRRAAGLH